MRIVPIDNEHSTPCNVICYECGERRRSQYGFADLDGPAFKAYYCRPCLANLGIFPMLLPMEIKTLEYNRAHNTREREI